MHSAQTEKVASHIMRGRFVEDDRGFVYQVTNVWLGELVRKAFVARSVNMTGSVITGVAHLIL